jgi:hypothetical protein
MGRASPRRRVGPSINGPSGKVRQAREFFHQRFEILQNVDEIVIWLGGRKDVVERRRRREIGWAGKEAWLHGPHWKACVSAQSSPCLSQTGRYLMAQRREMVGMVGVSGCCVMVAKQGCHPHLFSPSLPISRAVQEQAPSAS